MDARFIQERIAALCMRNGISEYSLSSALGLNKSYINKITRGKSLPSMTAFLQICDYFEISPKDFFDPEIESPCEISELFDVATRLTPKQVSLLIAVAKEME